MLLRGFLNVVFLTVIHIKIKLYFSQTYFVLYFKGCFVFLTTLL